MNPIMQEQDLNRKLGNIDTRVRVLNFIAKIKTATSTDNGRILIWILLINLIFERTESWYRAHYMPI